VLIDSVFEQVRRDAALIDELASSSYARWRRTSMPIT